MKKQNMFYNFNYNFGHETGQLKFCWGNNLFDLSKPIKPQLIEVTKLDEKEIFNLNLTAFNNLFIEETKESAA